MDLLQEFGNFHFGIVANAFGFGLEQSMAGAGAYQVLFQGGGSRMALPATSYLGAYGGLIPNSFSAYITNQGFSWADNPGDARLIMQGWNYAEGL